MKTRRMLLFVSLCVALITATAGSVSAATINNARAEVQERHQPAAPQGTKAKSVKAACVGLAHMLRSDGFAKVLTYLQTNGTREVIKTITRNAATIAKTLDYVVKWEELSAAMVRDQVTGALRTAGVSQSSATTAAYWIEQLLGAAIF